MTILAISAPQIILLAIVTPLVVFLFGFWVGKKSEYMKRKKEEQKK